MKKELVRWLLVVIITGMTSPSWAQRIFPNAEGFGSDSRGAYSGSSTPAILYVNSYADTESGNSSTGRGTLRWCLSQNYPRIVLFEVGGTFPLTEAIKVRNPYMSVYGQSAPGEGVLITGTGIDVRTHDILIQHISIRPGDDPNGPSPGGRDGLEIRRSAHHVVIDHCSFQWAIDENLSTWADGEHIQNITFSNCIIAEGLNYNIHNEGHHSKGILIGTSSDSISLIKNYIAHNSDRNPYVQGGTSTEIINNLVYNGKDAILFHDYASLPTYSSVINNHVNRGYDYTRPFPIRILNVSNSSRFYLSGNTDSSNDWPSIDDKYNREAAIRINEPEVSSASVNILARSDVIDHIFDNAGAHPWNRDAVDTRVLNTFTERSGRIPDCVTADDIIFPTGAVVAASSNTITLSGGNYVDHTEDDSFTQKFVEIISGTGAGQRQSVSGYNAGTLTITLGSAWDVIPNGQSQYAIITDCSNHAGGWFLYSPASHTLSVPNDPHSDADRDGYSNLENWIATLHDDGLLSLSFQVTNSLNSNPIDEAQINIAGITTGTTNASGQFFIDDLSPDQEIIYQVSAPLFFSQTDTFIINSNRVVEIALEPLPDLTAPTPPGNLRTLGITPTQVLFSWDASSDNAGVIGYIIYRNNEEIDRTSALNYTDTEAPENTQYQYTVAAYDASGNISSMSNYITITTFVEEATDTLSPKAPEKVFYINPESSSDAAPDGSQEKPYTSWSQVSWIEGYEYRQMRATTSYESKILVTASQITIGAYGQGELPRIVSTASDYAFSFYDKSHITISHIDLDFSTAIGGIYFAGAENDSNTVEYCRITGGDYSIRIVGGDSFNIRYNELSGYANAVYTLASNTNIYYNELTKSETAISINDYSSNVNIYNNVFAGNNTAISSSYGGLTLYNNIFSLDEPGSIAINQALDSLVSDYNIFYPAGSGFIRIGDNTFNDLATYQQHLGVDAHSMDDNPMFLDFLGGDYRIEKHSPAAEAGVDLGLTSDKYQSTVPYGNYPEIGIQEITEEISRLEELPSINSEALFTLYPNPNNGIFILKINDEVPDHDITITITGIQGNIIYSKHDFSGRMQRFNFNNLLPGQYQITVIQGIQTYTQALLIIE